jgi:hypothetical protein
MASVDYNCIPSLASFHRSQARVRIVRGPIGSGKTTGMIAELLRIACEQEPDPEDGIRRTRMLVVRNTLPQLKQTCLASILQFLRPIADWRPSESTVRIRFGDVESDWLLLPLDSEQNVQRLLSLELTFCWVSEAREVDPQLVMNALSRCGRYPSVAHGGATRYGLIAESNSFRTDSPWFELLEENLPPNWEYFVQPSALSPEADWLQYLPKTYYSDLIQSNDPEWVEQYIENKYGESLDGQAVFKNSFSKEFHVASDTLSPIPTLPLIVGMDFARHPAAVICQIDPRGRLLVLAEAEEENMGVEMFTNEFLTPLLASDRFRGCPHYVVGDPSGVSRSQIGEESVFDALRRLGYPAFPATTNQISPRIRAVEKFLVQQRGGGAAMLIDPSCHVLIQGFQSRYRYKKRSNGAVDMATPEKTRPWADVHDALQYACLGTSKSIRTRAINTFTPKTHTRPKIPVGAWT